MSSEHQSDSEDADESQDRPASTEKDEDPVRTPTQSVEEDDAPQRVCASPPGSCSEDPPERPAGSPRLEDKERCSPAAAPQAGSAGSSSRGGSLFSWLQSRTIRRGLFVDPARDNFRTMTSLYCSMNPAVESVSLSSQTHGAVFNLEYSPDG